MDLSPFEQNLQEAPQTLHYSTIQQFFTSKECFSHFNGPQLLSNINHFVLFSQAYFKITLKTKAFEKIYFSRFYWILNTSYVLQCSTFFGARLKNPNVLHGYPRLGKFSLSWVSRSLENAFTAILQLKIISDTGVLTKSQPQSPYFLMQITLYIVC